MRTAMIPQVATFSGAVGGVLSRVLEVGVKPVDHGFALLGLAHTPKLGARKRVPVPWCSGYCSWPILKDRSSFQTNLAKEHETKGQSRFERSEYGAEDK